MTTRQTLILIALVVGLSRPGAAQDFDPPPVRTSSEPAFHQYISSVTRQLLHEHRNSDREAALDNLMRMQIVAGDYGAAASTADQLSSYRASKTASPPAVLAIAYEIYAATNIEQSA